MAIPSVPASHAPTRPTRILFVSLYELGWKTWANQLERYCANIPNVEAVHLRVSRPAWMWALSRDLPNPIKRPLLSSRRSWAWQMKRSVVGAIESGNFDVVFVSSQIMAPVLLEPCRATGTSLAVAIDVTAPIYYRDLLQTPVAPQKRWKDEERIYNAADLCATMSSWAAASLHQDFHVPKDKIRVVVPAVEIRPPALHAEEKRYRKMPRILFCGNDWKRKGGPRLVRWHQELWAEKAELHITSATAPDLTGLPNVFHHGVVPYDTLVNEVLPSGDIFCLPTYNDMSPFAVSDAQAAGLATVTSRIGGMADLVIDGESGFLLSPDDEDGYKKAITRLIEDADLREQMGIAARKHASGNLDANKVFTGLINDLVALKKND